MEPGKKQPTLSCFEEDYDEGVYITDAMPLTIKTLEALARSERGTMTMEEISAVNPFAFEHGGFISQMQEWKHIVPSLTEGRNA